MSEGPAPNRASRIARWWRILATALCFFTFGSASLTYGLVVAPLLFLVVPSRPARQRAARALCRGGFRVLISMMRSLGILTVERVGFERLARPGLVIVANHPTYIDIVFLLASVPNAICVFKASILRNPVMLGPVLAAGYLVNREGPALIDAAAEALASGASLVIFPEGTRSPSGGPLHPFHRGAAHIALRAGSIIAPVRALADPPFLVKDRRWYDMPEVPSRFEYTVLPDIVVPRVEASDASREARRLTSRLEAVFKDSLAERRAEPPQTAPR